MSDFKKPQRSARSQYARFLYVDGEQVSDALSALEGGAIEEIQGRSSEEANKGVELGGELGVSGARVKASGNKNRKLVFEEEVFVEEPDTLQYRRFYGDSARKAPLGAYRTVTAPKSMS